MRARADFPFAVLLAAMLSASASAQNVPSELRVSVGDREVSVPIVTGPSGRAIRADLLAATLGGSVRRLANDHYMLVMPGVSFDLVPDLPFARIGADSVVPLAAAPYLQGGRIYVPLQLAAELLPRLGNGIIYDAGRGELRVFNAAAARGPVATPGLEVRSGAREESGGAIRPVQRAPERRSGAGSTRLNRQHTIVVDAGHGGVDNGMTGPLKGGPRIFEKNITLDVARAVELTLRERGVEVVMTRTADTLIALSDRGRIANRNRGDLFLSIHVNAASMRWKRPGDARGFETFFLAEAKTEDARRVEQMENEAVRFETTADTHQGDPLNFIINDMAQNEHLRESSELAELVQTKLAGFHPGPNRGVKQAGFRVLVTAFMPAVLIEIGFGTNAAEAKYINSTAGQRKIAAAIADAAIEYLSQYERRVGQASP